MKSKTNISKNKNLIYGLEILRAYLSYSIIVIHFLSDEYKNSYFAKFIFYCYHFYVPTFFLMSFYFVYYSLINRNITKIKERIIRIIVPYTIWPILFWLLNIIIHYKEIKFDINIIRSIFLQLLIGCNFYAIFWFQFDLIMITFIFVIIIFIFRTYSLNILIILSFFFFIINKNYEDLFQNYNSICSIRPMLTSYIYSITGFYLGSKFIIRKLSNKRYLIFIPILLAIILIYNYEKLFSISDKYKIIDIDIVITCLFLIFSLLPFELMQNEVFIIIVKQLTRYTGGIYYTHVEIERILSPSFIVFRICNLKSCFLIYL